MFGLFASKRQAATRAAVELMRPYIGIVQHTYGLPPRFWFDPYVLGFTQFMIGHFAKLASHGKIAGDDLGTVLVDSLTALSNMNGVAIAREVTSLALKADADFNKGGDDAATLAFYKMKVLKNENDNLLVRKAAAVIDAQQPQISESERRNEIASIMFMLIPVFVIIDRQSPNRVRQWM